MKLVAPLLAIAAATLLISTDLKPAQPSGLVVHEWGTFTSVAGEDGSAIDWDALGCKNDLPQFVNDDGYRGFKWRLRGTVRMETPVLYFYSSQPIDAHVKVSFPQGLITEWYPKADYRVYRNAGGSLRPLPSNLNGFDISMRTLTGSIEWTNIKVQPDASLDLPVEKDGSHYYAARQTDAAPLTVGGQNEKFLFYRGVARFPVPLSVRIAADNKVLVNNRAADAVPAAILFENRGGHIGYRSVSPIDSVETIDRPTLDGSLAQLRLNLETILVSQGLFQKEAHAMVETWKDSWFEAGTRLIYIVPRASIASILPLEIEPAAETERVFVGRIELITPEILETAEAAIVNSDAAPLRPYARFREPILNRVQAMKPSLTTEIERLTETIDLKLRSGHCETQ